MLSNQETRYYTKIGIRARSLTTFFRRASFLFLFPMKCRASLTIEASLVLPIFLFYMMTLLYSLEIVRFQSDVREALHQEATRESFAAYGVRYGNAHEENEAEQRMRAYLEKQLLPYLCAEGNGEGLSFDVKKNAFGTDNRQLSVSYTVKPFLFLLPIGDLAVTDSVLIHDWTGYQKDAVWSGEDRLEAYVYITPTGKKYHLLESCTYLKVRLRAVDSGEIDRLRNADGEIYHPCEVCGTKVNNIVYLTEWGNRYHGRNDCRAIQKTVYMVPLSQVGERTVCKKCR